MAKLGTEKRPIIARVHSDEMAQYVTRDPNLYRKRLALYCWF